MSPTERETEAYAKLLEEYRSHRLRVHHTADLNCLIKCGDCGFFEHRLVLMTEDPEDGHNI
jgi:hypothetical protein